MTKKMIMTLFLGMLSFNGQATKKMTIDPIADQKKHEMIAKALRKYYPDSKNVTNDFIKEIGKDLKDRSEEDKKYLLEIAGCYSAELVALCLNQKMNATRFKALKWLQDRGVMLNSQHIDRVVELFSNLFTSKSINEQNAFKNLGKDLNSFFKKIEWKAEAREMMRTILRVLNISFEYYRVEDIPNPRVLEM